MQNQQLTGEEAETTGRIFISKMYKEANEHGAAAGLDGCPTRAPRPPGLRGAAGPCAPSPQTGALGQGDTGGLQPHAPWPQEQGAVPDAALRTQPVLQRGHGPENVITQYELPHR